MRFSTLLCLGGLFVSAITSKAQNTAPTWQWAKALTSVSGAYLNKAVVDANGNVYVLGGFEAPLTIDPTTVLTSTGQEDAFIASFSKAGALRWVQQFKGPKSEYLSGLAVDRSGNVFAMGSYTQSMQIGTITANISGTSQHAFVVKLNAKGEPQWLRENGGTGFAFGSDVTVDSQDNLYITGIMNGEVSFGNQMLTNNVGNARDIYLVKYTSQGVVEWARQGGRTLNNRTYFNRVSVSPKNEVYLSCALDGAAGSFGSQPMPAGRGSVDGIIVKYSAQGVTEWVQRVGGPGLDLTLGNLAFDAAGRVGVGVRYEGTATVGNQTLTGSGIRTGALVVLDAATGAPVWTRPLLGSNISDCGDVVADGSGNFYITGFFDGTVTINGTSITSAGGTDALIARFSSQGVLDWVKTSTGAGSESSYYVGIDSAGDLVICGSFVGIASFDTQQLSSQATDPMRNIFVARLGSTVTNTKSPSISAFTPYPNPVQATAQLQLPKLPAHTTVNLFDAQGRLVRQTKTVVAGATQVPLLNCAAGTYYLQITAPESKPVTSRLIVTP